MSLPRFFLWFFFPVSLALGGIALACEPAKVACIPGATVACACISGPPGVQTCLANGTYDLCKCASEKEKTSEVSTEPVQDKTLPDTPPTDSLPEKQAEATRPEPSAEPTPESSQDTKIPEPAPEKRPDTPSNVQGLALMDRLAGLWIGAASQTPLGTFPIMMMDIRDASPHVLFSRVDLDEKNSLRFAFSIENHEGKDVLIYRNGGYFLGILRDSRAALISYDPASSTWRFCAVGSGCSYIDATFTFLSADALILDVKVRGKPHLYWQAERKEKRTLPSPFPKDETSQGTGQAPFPPMPSLRATVTWNPPLTQDAEVWLLLSTTPCGLTFSCQASRSIRVFAPAGSSSAQVLIEQLHKGSYHLNAILDRNRDMATTRFPNSGDGIAFPLDQSVTIPSSGQASSSLSIFYNVP